MEVKKTKPHESNQNPERFDIRDLTPDDLELIHLALIDVKHHSLQDAEAFRTQRKRSDELYYLIESELIKLRS